MSRSRQAERISGWVWELFGLHTGELLRVANDRFTHRAVEWNRRGFEAKLLSLLSETKGPTYPLCEHCQAAKASAEKAEILASVDHGG